MQYLSVHGALSFVDWGRVKLKVQCILDGECLIALAFQSGSRNEMTATRLRLKVGLLSIASPANNSTRGATAYFADYCLVGLTCIRTRLHACASGGRMAGFMARMKYV
jgi:hypothetical protein